MKYKLAFFFVFTVTSLYHAVTVFSNCPPSWSITAETSTFCPITPEKQVTWQINWQDGNSETKDNFASGGCCSSTMCLPRMEEPFTYPTTIRNVASQTWRQTSYDRRCNGSSCQNDSQPRSVTTTHSCRVNECESNLLNCSESNEQEIIACLAQCRIWNASGFCEPFRPGECASEQAGCNCSPIVIDIAGNGFNLTNVTNGVDFDLNGDGIINSRIAWTSTNSDDAWLALDRNQNGTIENGQELFGNFTLQPESNEKNGFLALAEFDKVANGGNADGNITNSDSVFNNLRLWQDANRNGISEANELKTLQSQNIMKLELDYRESKKTDEHGNRFKYRAKVKDGNNAQVGRWAWDVFVKFENY